MTVNIDNLVSLTEANRNFSKVSRMVDENGVAVILRNNVPRYLLLDIDNLRDNGLSGVPTVQNVNALAAKKRIKDHDGATESANNSEKEEAYFALKGILSGHEVDLKQMREERATSK